MIEIRRAPAYATVQDEGRGGYLSSGVPRAGCMDVATLRSLNAILGNTSGAAVLEWALTSGELFFATRAVFAIGGANTTVTLNDKPLDAYRAYQAGPNESLSIEAPLEGRFLYLAFAGGIDTPVIMSSRSTYMPGGFGGVDGRRLKDGDTIPLGVQGSRRHYVIDPLPLSLIQGDGHKRVRFVAAQSGDSIAGEWKISSSSDRTGYRLTGRTVEGGASITSTAVCPGTIQLPPGGEPIVLMADAPTVGGYRIAGAVATADLGRVAQLVPGASVTFEEITVDAAQRLLFNEAERIERIREWAIS